MIRICHVITDLNVGGAERMLVNLVERLDRSQFANEVVSLIEPGAMAAELAHVPLTSIGMRRGRPSLPGFGRLLRHLRRSRPTIVQSWLYHADLACALACRFVPAAALVWNLRCSDFVDLPGEKKMRRIVRLLARMSGMPAAVIANSDRGQAFHRGIGYRPQRWAVIPNGVDGERFCPRPEARSKLRRTLSIAGDAPVIGLVARFHAMKDFPNFLDAAALFAKARPDSRFVLCGDGCDRDNDALVRMIAERQLAERAILLGVRSDMEHVYPAFDVATLASAFGEGFPNVLVEAMACGVPCVATDVGDCRAIVADTGAIVPPRDPTALMRGWESVLDRSNDLDTRARMRAVEHYGIARACRAYESLYRDIVSGNPEMAGHVRN